ncbi:TagK domain-containing protein [Paraburkholderia adhaesiva]|uniref:TagK domain-containing protein n=1 Tax=Paraburkholderia adhaesiva TaxID=2883244 RepID=UPI001F20D2EA|nr:TagK domain-containing protein [Paraburkholderia adhaesiva]
MSEVPRDALRPLQRDAVYDVIGGGRVSVAHATNTTGTTSLDANQLLDMLYAQYRLALVLPDSVHQEGRWIAGNLRHEMCSVARDRAPVMKGTVSDFLQGIQSIDQAFGPLGGELPESLQPQEPPEVLALFAPPELQASVARHESMPQLARREHHLVSIDSPVSGSQTVSDTLS